MKKIDWDKVWKDYDSWYRVATVKAFNRTPSEADIREKIQSLIEAQLKPKRKK